MVHGIKVDAGIRPSSQSGILRFEYLSLSVTAFCLNCCIRVSSSANNSGVA